MGFRPLPFLGIHFKENKIQKKNSNAYKRKKNLLIVAMEKKSTLIKSFKQKKHTAEKNNSILTPIAKNGKFLPILNHLPDNGVKMLGAVIVARQTPSTLNCQPGGFIDLETKHMKL